jgi:hypothetical protein
MNSTSEGQSMLNFTENSLNLICRKIGTDSFSAINLEAGVGNSTTPRFLKKTHHVPVFG